MSNLKSIFLAAALIVGGITVANGQLTQGSVMRVEIPTSFVIMDKTFPAGEYTLERTPSIIDSPSLMILRGEGKAIVFDSIAARSSRAPHNSQLIFDIVGGTNYLSKIEVKGTNIAIAIPQSKSVKNNRGPVTQRTLTVDTGF